MKIFQILLLSTLLCTFSACGDDDVVVDPTPTNESYWSCKVDGETFESSGLWAYATTFSIDNTIAVYGSDDLTLDVYRTMFISLDDAGAVGTYDLALNGNAVAAFTFNDPSKTYLSNLPEGNGTMEITSIDETFVEGTFSFKGINGDDETDVIEVTEGTFKVKFN